MPSYPVKCPACGPSHVQAPAALCMSLKCPTCGKPVEQDWEAKLGSIQFSPAINTLTGHRRKMLRIRFRPDEVPALREKFGADGSCLGDDGKVTVPDRATQKRVVEKFEALRDAQKNPT